MTADRFSSGDLGKVAKMFLQGRIEAATGLLRQSTQQHAPCAFACSFGIEDMVIFDLIDRANLGIEIFTLDTGRLHEETYTLMQRARERYPRPLRVMFPHASSVEEFAQAEGVNGFYGSIEVRKRCCEIRKVEPLRRALQGKKLWITGLRREQSPTRADLETLAFDPANGLMKLNPLLDWSEADVRDYVQRFDVPVNALHARGFPSIGCAPCTRAVQPGEDARAGRWWWEQPESKECGLHVDPTGKLVRTGRVRNEGELA
jgi:phosphoadenosine phosphosulfate reductase